MGSCGNGVEIGFDSEQNIDKREFRAKEQGVWGGLVNRWKVTKTKHQG